MTSRHRLATSLVFSLLLTAPGFVKSQAPGTPTQSAPTAETPQKPTVAGTVIFAVNRISDGVTLDPIVIFNKGQYIDPLPDDEAFVQQVAAKYLRAGQKHRVIFGGAEAGMVTVTDRHEFLLRKLRLHDLQESEGRLAQPLSRWTFRRLT